MRGRLGSGRTGEHWATLFVPRPATPAPTGFRPQCAQEARIAVDLRSSESLPDLSLLTAAGAVVGTGRGCWNGNAASMVVRSQGCFPFVFVSVWVWGFASLCWVCKGAGANSAPALLGVVSPFISKGWRLLCPDFAFGGVRFPVLVVLGWLGARSSVHVSLSQSVARSNELLVADSLP